MYQNWGTCQIFLFWDIPPPVKLDSSMNLLMKDGLDTFDVEAAMPEKGYN